MAPLVRARENAPGRGRFATVAAIVVAAAAVVTVLSVSLVHANDQVSQLQHAQVGSCAAAGAWWRRSKLLVTRWSTWRAPITSGWPNS